MRSELTDAIVILAGGRATRFPGKLETAIAGAPLLARVYDNVRAAGPVTIAGRGGFSPELEAMLDCPVVVDRWPDRGPLGGLLSAAYEIDARRIFAVAGDAPFVDARVLDALRAQWVEGDEAAVPVHGDRFEPLAALYDRAALVREGWRCLQRGDLSMRALLARLRTRRVPLDAEFFINVNTPNDLPGLQETT
jgi:molybdenum cofactor guanylyltransferase